MHKLELLLKRVHLANDYTIGKLYINGLYFCDTIEDKRRFLRNIKDKVYGETAIPEGRYKVELTVSPRFKKVLPRLINVPYFQGILIHAGNTAKDSHGCILVGQNTVKGKVLKSAATMVALMLKLNEAKNSGKEIWITVAMPV